MNSQISWLALGVAFLTCATHSVAQTNGPDPREIPVPAIKTTTKPMPGVDKLPVRTELPDILTMNNGTKVTTLAQWKKRREEIRKILEYYAVGSMPPAPGNVQGQEMHSELVLDGKVKYRLIKLSFGPDRKLELYIGVFTPTDAKLPGAGDHLAELRTTRRTGVAAEFARPQPGQGRRRPDDGWAGSCNCGRDSAALCCGASSGDCGITGEGPRRRVSTWIRTRHVQRQ